MTRLLVLMLAALLVCSLPAVAFTGSLDPEPASDGATRHGAVDGESTDWLTLSDGPTASGDGYVAVDLGAALADDSTRLEARYDDHRIDARMEVAESDAQRRAIIREEESRLSEEVTRLRERERNAYSEYYEGERTERELLSELAVIHTSAVALAESISSLEEHAAATPGVSLESELDAMEVETLTMQGPVRERVAEMMHGEADATRVHIETDGEGVVLAAVDGDQFHREIHHADNRDPGAEPEYTSLGQSENRIAELYPSIFPDARWSYSEVGYGTHRGIGNHAQGTTTVYLDTGTGEVYREFQTLRLNRIDTAAVASETDDGVELTVDRTVPGGPARATVTDAETGAAISGEVALDGRTVGETDDGEVWFVAPRDSVTVTASVGPVEVELPISQDQEIARMPTDEGS